MYLSAYQRWVHWAEARQGVPVFTVQDIHLALYLTHLSGSTGSKASIEVANACPGMDASSSWSSAGWGVPTGAENSPAFAKVVGKEM